MDSWPTIKPIRLARPAQYRRSYTVLLGGISFGDFQGGIFQTDAQLPFINQVTTIKRDRDGVFAQYLMDAEYPVIPSTGSHCRGRPKHAPEYQHQRRYRRVFLHLPREISADRALTGLRSYRYFRDVIHAVLIVIGAAAC